MKNSCRSSSSVSVVCRNRCHLISASLRTKVSTRRPVRPWAWRNALRLYRLQTRRGVEAPSQDFGWEVRGDVDRMESRDPRLSHQALNSAHVIETRSALSISLGAWLQRFLVFLKPASGKRVLDAIRNPHRRFREAGNIYFRGRAGPTFLRQVYRFINKRWCCAYRGSLNNTDGAP